MYRTFKSSAGHLTLTDRSMYHKKILKSLKLGPTFDKSIWVSRSVHMCLLVNSKSYRCMASAPRELFDRPRNQNLSSLFMCTVRYVDRTFLKNISSDSTSFKSHISSISLCQQRHSLNFHRNISNMAAKGIKLKWNNIDKDRLRADADAMMENLKKVYDEVGALSDDSVTYENVVKVTFR